MPCSPKGYTDAVYPSNMGRTGDAAIVRAVELDERPQSLGEEIANSVSHGIGLLAALAAFPVLVVAAVGRGEAAGIVGASRVRDHGGAVVFHVHALSRAAGNPAASGYSRFSITRRSTS